MSPSSTAIAYQNPKSCIGDGCTGSDWNSMNNDGLDFDLLAEYLLEDINDGGFDFSGPETYNAPSNKPLHDQHQQQPQQTWETPSQNDNAGGVCTPSVVTADSRPSNGDGEMKQVQQHNMMMHQQQQQQQQRIMHEPPSAPLLLEQPPPIKRPRVDVAAASTAAVPAIAVPMKVVGHYSFAAASASTSTFQRHPGSLGVGGGGGVGGGRPSSGGSGGIPLTFSSSATHPTQAVSSSSHDAAATRPKSSQASQDRRRERNRILARRTRLRKKFFFESLQKDVSDLQRENATLKGIVRNRLPIDDANILLEGCDANERLPVIDLLGCGGEGEDGDGLAAIFPPSSGGRGDDETTSSLGRGGGERDVTKLDRDDYSLIRSIQNSQHCFIITDPSLHDNPIVYASDDFLSLTGYSQSDVLGRNCRFLQGSETHTSKVKMIRDAVESGEDCSVVLVNYTSDGEPFWNSLFIAALRDADSNIVNFIGVIVKVAGPEPGDIEYGKVLKE